MNCQSGVYVVDNQDVNVYKNAMANMGFTGIYFEECRYNTVNIEYDTIDGGDYGIYGRYFRRRATVNILNNYLTYQDGLGITVENDVLAGANVNIQNNYIFRPEMYGIQVTNINNNSDIDYNEVYFYLTNAGLSSEHIGILIQNSPYAHVYGNIVQNTGGTISTYPQYLKGIAVQTTTYPDLCDNDVTQVGYGLYFNGYCLNSKIKRTDMTSCYVGIRLESATLGQQGSSAQPWDNRWYSNVGSYRITGTPSVPIDWYYRTSAGQYLITPLSVFPIPAIVQHPTNPISMFSCGVIPLGFNQANSTSSTQVLSADDQYYSDLNFLRKSDMSGSSFISTISPDIDQIEDAVSAWEDGNMQSFVSNTSAITSDSIQAQNHRIVNNVLMHLPLIPQDSLTLYDIAVQNPLSGGEAVYTARVLLGMHWVRTPADIADKSAVQHNEVEEWRIYPNPVNEELTIEPPFESNWLIDIYTIDGKRVFSHEEVLVSDFVQLDIAFIPSGLYRIVLTDKSGQKKYSTAFRKE